MDKIQEKYNQLLLQYKVLQEENEALKALLHSHGIAYGETRTRQEDYNVYSSETVPAVNLSLDDRVKLFRSLFKGREDVFARRWFSKTTGKSGYQPVCTN